MTGFQLCSFRFSFQKKNYVNNFKNNPPSLRPSDLYHFSNANFVQSNTYKVGGRYSKILNCFLLCWSCVAGWAYGAVAWKSSYGVAPEVGSRLGCWHPS